MKRKLLGTAKFRHIVCFAAAFFLLCIAALLIVRFSAVRNASNPAFLMEHNPLLREDSKLLRLLEEGESCDTFLLGSYSAQALDPAYAGELADGVCCNLCTEGSDPSKTAAIFDLLTATRTVKTVLLAFSPYDASDLDRHSAYEAADLFNGEAERDYDDVRRIGNLETYLTERADRFLPQKSLSLTRAEEWLQTIQHIAAVCREKNIRFVTFLCPVYRDRRDGLNAKELAAFRTELAEALAEAEFWDFTDAALCSDARFFYNRCEFRKTIGDKMLARAFGDKMIYVPDDFGVCGVNRTAPNAEKRAVPYEMDVPILLYHHVTEEAGYGDAVISLERLEEHFTALHDAGYTTVLPEELIDYVYLGKELPEKSICITFDDGYQSNYELVYPLLEKYDFKIAIFPIGWAFGKDTYKDTDQPMLAHFDYAAAREMLASGRVALGSHTYDMHQSETLETADKPRYSALRHSAEKKEDYVAALENDFENCAEVFERELKLPVTALSYPHGSYSLLSETVFMRLGVKITLSTEYSERNTLVKGLPQSLYALRRFTVSESSGADALLALIASQYGDESGTGR